MSEPRSIQLMQALESCLQQITTANGYYTDAGQHITRGWLNHAMASRGQLPRIAIHPESESGASAAGAKRKRERIVAVEGVLEAEDNPADDLDRLLADLMRALPLGEMRPLGGLAIQISAPDVEFSIPDPGSRLAVVSLSMTVSYVANYEA